MASRVAVTHLIVGSSPALGDVLSTSSIGRAQVSET